MNAGIATFLGGAGSGVTLYDEEFAFFGISRGTVGELRREIKTFESTFPNDVIASGAGSFSSTGGESSFANDFLSDSWVFFKIVTEVFGHDFIDIATHLWVTEFVLGLAFELWIWEFNQDNSGETFFDIITGKVVFLLFEESIFTGVIVNDTVKTSTETNYVHTAIRGKNVICEWFHDFGESIVILKSDFDASIVNLLLDVEYIIR